MSILAYKVLLTDGSIQTYNGNYIPPEPRPLWVRIEAVCCDVEDDDFGITVYWYQPADLRNLSVDSGGYWPREKRKGHTWPAPHYE